MPTARGGEAFECDKVEVAFVNYNIKILDLPI
jgi:hypothetical protein